MARKKCYDEGGLSFADESTFDKDAAIKEALEAADKYRGEQTTEEEKPVKRVAKAAPKAPAVSSRYRDEGSEGAAKSTRAPDEAPRVVRQDRTPEAVKVNPITGPSPATSAAAALPDRNARMAASMARQNQRRSALPAGQRGVGMKAGGSVSSASKRADGAAIRGKTKGRMV